MAFVKCTLTEVEKSLIRLDEERYIPKYDNWSCVRNVENGAVFTQLISNTQEMLDGFYWYILLINGKQAIISISYAYSLQKQVDGKNYLEGYLSGCDADLSKDLVGKMASEAMDVLSDYKETLIVR